MMMKMTRSVKGKERYYTLQVFLTLFGETLVVRTYGACANAKPTGILLEYYTKAEEAQQRVQILAHRKRKGGYAVEKTLIPQENPCLC